MCLKSRKLKFSGWLNTIDTLNNEILSKCYKNDIEINTKTESEYLLGIHQKLTNLESKLETKSNNQNEDGHVLNNGD